MALNSLSTYSSSSVNTGDKAAGMLLPKISIVTPSYNQGEYLEATILSVLGQNYPNFEYIIMDGGSNDDSVKIIEKYEKQLAYWVSQKDNGQAAAINAGFKKASGDIFLWINSDDILMPNVLFAIAEIAIKEGDKLFIGNCIHFNELKDGTLKAWGSNVPEKNNLLQIELIDYIIQPSSFWTKAVWQKNGELNEKLHFVFDWEWFLRAKKNGIEIHGVNKCLSLYRIHENHKSASAGGKKLDELATVYEKYSPSKVQLFKQLRKRKHSLFSKILYRIYLLLGKKNQYGIFFKYCYPIQFKGHSVKEINMVLGMV